MKLEEMKSLYPKPFQLPLNLQFFAGGEGDGDEPGGDGGGDLGDGGSAKGQGDGGQGDEPVTFTQDDIDGAKKETERQTKLNLYKELGVKSLNDLKVKVSEVDTLLEEVGVSSVQEIKDKIKSAADGKSADESLKSENESYKGKVETLESRIKDMQVEREFWLASQEHKPHDFDLLFNAAKPMLEFDPDTGEVVNMDKVLSDLKEKKSFLFQADEQGGDNLEGGGDDDDVNKKKFQKPNSTKPGSGNPPEGKKGKELGAELARKRNERLKKN